MNKIEFAAAVDRCTGAIYTGTMRVRATTKQVVIDEHARLYDGIAEIMRRYREERVPIEHVDLARLLAGEGPTVERLGEESGFTDGLNFEGAHAIRELKGNQ